MDEITNLLEVTMITLVVEGEAVDSDLGHLLDIIARVGDVHVAIKVNLGKVFSHPADHGGTNGEVGDEMSTFHTIYPSMMSM